MQTIQKYENTPISIRQEPEGQGIPFHLVRELILYCQYGTAFSVGIKTLYYTGCRISEVDFMCKSKIARNFIYWNCGKNQNGWRKEYLPDEFLAEMQFYWNHNPTIGDKLLGISSSTLTRYFREVRSKLSPEWREQKTIIKAGTLEDNYKYVFKGFRKNFVTLLFCYFYRKYNDAGVAVEMVSKRMKHSSRYMTVRHYIETMEQIEADKYVDLMPFEIVDRVIQERITDYI